MAELIEDALMKNGGNAEKAAFYLGLPVQSFRRRAHACGIDWKETVARARGETPLSNGGAGLWLFSKSENAADE